LAISCLCSYPANSRFSLTHQSFDEIGSIRTVRGKTDSIDFNFVAVLGEVKILQVPIEPRFGIFSRHRIPIRKDCGYRIVAEDSDNVALPQFLLQKMGHFLVAGTLLDPIVMIGYLVEFHDKDAEEILIPPGSLYFEIQKA